jgi:hypothetical protein
LPHSDIRGSPGARPSPRLFAACHVLHRLSVPRHPPDALLVLRPRPAPSTPRAEIRWQRTDDRPILADLLDVTRAAAQTAAPADARASASRIPMLQVQPHPRRVMAGPASRSRLASRYPENRGQRTEHRPPGPSRPFSVATRGHPMPERTCQGRFRPLRLCPLPSELSHACVVGLGRFERPTSRLSGVRSDQLSYRPKIRDQKTESRQQTASRVGASAPLRPVCHLISVLCPLTWKGCVDGDPGRLAEARSQMPEVRQ